MSCSLDDTNKDAEKATKLVDDAWKQTVRDIFDECHFGPVSVFEEGSGVALAFKILEIIEKRHSDYFCNGITMPEWEALLAEKTKKEQ